MDINFELYKVFYYVANTLSFSEAAAKLFISQSAVSQSMKQLEEKLGSKLIYRNTKRVQLTSEGEILFKYVEQAFNFIKTGESSLNEIERMQKGDIHIAASDTICKYYLLPYFKKFNEMYPKIKIHITNRTSPQCIELLRKGYVDFCVINIPEGSYIDKNIKIIETKTIQDVFIAGQNYSHLKNKCVSFKELEAYPLIALEKNTSTRSFFDNFMKANDVNLIPEIELGSIELLIELAKIGLGISYVISDCIHTQLKNNEIFIISTKEKIPERKIGIAYSSKIPLKTAANEFTKLLGCKNLLI